MARTVEQVREAKRLHMARKRAANPQAMRDQQRAWCDANRESVREKNRSYWNRRFFWARMTKLRGPERASHVELARLWKSQRGLCGLTGETLDRLNADLDHILPKARGGKDDITNLRWVTKEVNMVKRDLTDDEFFALCGQVVRWIGQRIDIMENLIQSGRIA